MHGGSLDKFWAGCIRDEIERGEVGRYVSERGKFRRRRGREVRGRAAVGMGSGSGWKETDICKKQKQEDGATIMEDDDRNSGMKKWEEWYRRNRAPSQHDCSDQGELQDKSASDLEVGSGNRAIGSCRSTSALPEAEVETMQGEAKEDIASAPHQSEEGQREEDGEEEMLVPSSQATLVDVDAGTKV